MEPNNRFAEGMHESVLKYIELGHHFHKKWKWVVDYGKKTYIWTIVSLLMLNCEVFLMDCSSFKTIDM